MSEQGAKVWQVERREPHYEETVYATARELSAHRADAADGIAAVSETEGVWYPLDADPARRVEELEAERDEATEDSIREGGEVLELREAVEGQDRALNSCVTLLEWIAHQSLLSGDDFATLRSTISEAVRQRRRARALLASEGEGAEDADA